MASLTRTLKALLRDAGRTFVRQGKGDLEIWYSPMTRTNFPIDSSIRYRRTANKTLKDAGLPKAF